MKLLERNYNDSLQVYSFSDTENDKEAQVILRWNLLSRLSKLVKDDLSQEDKVEQLLPRTDISITKITNPSVANKTMYLSELKVDGMNFPSTEDSIDDSLVKNLDELGIAIPKESLNNRLKTFYSGRVTSKPFNILHLKGEDMKEARVSEREFSYIEDSMYSDADDEENHYKMVRAVSMLALHKHVTENPGSPRERLVQGINNLSKEITDARRKQELHDYLMIYIEKPGSRALLVKEAELVVSNRAKAKGKGIPLWVYLTVISVILVGGLLYSQRDKIRTAWKATVGIKNEAEVKPDFNTKKSFLRMLFTKGGREEASSFVNNKKKSNSAKFDLSNFELWKRQREVDRDTADKAINDILNKYRK